VTVRILEPSSAGHRLYYVRVLAEGCAEPVEWVTTLDAVSSPEAAVHLGAVVESGRLAVRVLEPWPSKVQALAIAGSSAADVVVVPDGDRWLPAAAVVLASALRRPRTTYRLLMMRPELADSVPTGVASRLRRVAKGLVVQAISVLNRAHSVVEVFGLVDAFGYGADLLRSGVTPVADPVAERAVPEISRDDSPALVVGLLGAVDLRKNPELLASACREVFRDIDGRLLVVGGVSAEAADALAKSGLTNRQLTVENRYVDEAELVSAAATCDVIALLYSNHDSSSGVLALAAQVGTAVLVPYGSRLAATADRGGFGLPATLTVDGVSAALRGAVERAGQLRAAARRAGELVGTEDFVTKLAGPAK
jgi:glycosyltransferase involved in cell wall biosynthesis